MPAFLYDAFNVVDNAFLKNWIEQEALQPLFKDDKVEQNYLKDLAGTGHPCQHMPRDIKLELLLENYIIILEERKSLLTTSKSA